MRMQTPRERPSIIRAGDYRMMIAPLPNVPANRFRADNNYVGATPTTVVRFAEAVVGANGDVPCVTPTSVPDNSYGSLVPVTGTPVPGAPYEQTGITAGGNIARTRQPCVPSRVGNQVKRVDGGNGDWDTGYGDQPDGPYLNKPDEGDTVFTDGNGGVGSPPLRIPYMTFHNSGYQSESNTYFSPDRMVPSPMMFGSLPTGVQRNLPWQSLLFNPHPEDTTHPGLTTPRDHLLADLFWTPVIEPYAISEPFATAGKINMNYQIMPFTYIERQTAMYGVMKSTKFMALAASDAPIYKWDLSSNTTPGITTPRRHAIDIPGTLTAFDTKFAANDIYRSATQISEINLIPQDQPLPANTDPGAYMSTFWQTNILTGNNLRDKPYVDLYPPG